MRDYSKVAPQFWTGSTGRQLRPLGAVVRVVACYVMTSPHANMLGLYYCPLAYIANDTGCSIEEAQEALVRLSNAGFCHFDSATEFVWVLEMARFQIGEQLDAKDKRVVGIAKEYAALPNNPYLKPFFDRYARAFHLKEPRDFDGASSAPRQAPSMPGAGTGERTGTGKLPPDDTPRVAKPTERKAHGSPEDHAIARRMFEAIKVVVPSAKEPNWDGWANAVRLMREQDKRTHDEIWTVFDWANKDSFWRANVLSPTTLRDRWNQLEAKRLNPRGAPPGPAGRTTDYGPSGRI